MELGCSHKVNFSFHLFLRSILAGLISGVES